MLVLIFLGILCVFSARATNSSKPEPDTYYPAIEWSDTFDWKLLKAYSTNYRNVLISPIGLKLVLALLYEGAGGLTEREFQMAMQFSTDKAQIREHFRNVLEALQPSERREYILNLGTRIFLDSHLTPQQNFAAKALDSYRTNIESTNFSEPYSASGNVNSWVEKLTNGKLNNLVSAGDLQDAIMIVANAIYFKGTWRQQFPRNNSIDGGFYVSPTQVLNVPYMKTVDQFYYFESSELDAKILRLPYKGGNYGFFIVLPNAKGGLSDLIRKLNLQVLKKQLHMMDHVAVEVCLPKFKFNFQARHSQALQDFGLRQMFQNTASFPGIARGMPNLLRMLVVSDIVQKAGIEINEEGSEIYAATEIQVGNKFKEVDYVFNATHPFLFFVEEQSTGTILFVGKLENPLEYNEPDLPSRFGDNAGGLVQPLGNTPNLQPEDPERDAITRRFNFFDLELLKEFSESSGNVFISPASIKTTLALILEGAKGRSAEEIGSALRIDDINRRDIRQLLQRLLFDLNDRRANTALESGNALFVSDKYKLVPEYANKVNRHYKALTQSLNFSNPEQSAGTINFWVRNTTHGLIDQIVDAQNLQGNTQIILTNALFFKGKWKTAFDPSNTRNKCFRSPTRNCVNVPMMELTANLSYAFNVDLNSHVVELPYLDDKYAMLLLVPNSDNNVRTLARDMQHSQLNHILDGLRLTELIVELPRFEIEYSEDLVNVLANMNVREIFGDNANLTGIIAKDNIKVSKLIHKTKVEVNEQGTKAAAVTGAVVVPLMGVITQRVVADRPFIFFIYHRESSNIIFEGMLAEPKAVENSIKSRSSFPQRSDTTRYGARRYIIDDYVQF